MSHTEHAVGQSLVSWTLYAVLSLLWAVYGVLERKPPIYLGNGIALVLNSAMSVGIISHAGMTF